MYLVVIFREQSVYKQYNLFRIMYRSLATVATFLRSRYQKELTINKGIARGLKLNMQNGITVVFVTEDMLYVDDTRKTPQQHIPQDKPVRD
jgi:hypothetical protein